jgi:hypothetical protein
LNEKALQKILKPVAEILERGNTAEVRKTKDGIMLFEVKRKETVRLLEDGE